MQVLQEPLGNLSAELRQRFAQIGAVWGRDINAHRDLVVNAYTPLVATAANDVADGCEVQREVSYGPHERQRLDVFVHTATREAGSADVVVFVHGGAFLRGSKSFNGLIYDNVSRWFARQGWVRRWQATPKSIWFLLRGRPVPVNVSRNSPPIP